MSIRVEKEGKGARILSNDSVIELKDGYQIRSVIQCLETILDDIVSSNRKNG